VPGNWLTVQLGHDGACWAAQFLLDEESGKGPSLLKATRSFD
jgi:hypothetical protein